MDYKMTLDKYVTQINNQLGDVESLNPAQITSKLQNITKSGFQPYIIQTIRTCIQHFQKDRTILKYAFVVDKLLKLPVWNQMMQNVIVQFFCDIFIFLLIQKCFNQIDELKILRKFWLKTIHPRHHQAMKDIILVETGIDIDQYFKAQAIGLLKSHYENKLRLTPEEMHFHLPKTLKTSNIIYETKPSKTQQDPFVENANYMITQTPNPPMMTKPAMNPNIIRRSQSPEPIMNAPNQLYHNPYPSIPSNQYHQNILMMQNDPYRMKAQNIPQRISPPLDSRDPRMMMQKGYASVKKPMIHQENIPFYPENPEFAHENYKRERLYSEETRTPTNGSEYMFNYASIKPTQIYPPTAYETQVYPPIKYEQYEGTLQPQKKVHYNEEYQNFNQQKQRVEKEQQKPKHSKILEMLRGDRVYKCKQCGKGYKSMAQYEKHTNEHFDEKISLREKKKHNMKLFRLDQWTQKGSNSGFQQFDQFYITLSNLTTSCPQDQKIQPLQLKCKLCNESFDLKFHVDQWVLKNATYCKIDGLLAPLHKTCQQALEQSSSGEQI